MPKHLFSNEGVFDLAERELLTRLDLRLVPETVREGKGRLA